MKNRKEYNKKYYQLHKEEYRKRTAEWIKNNPEYAKKYYQDNKERILSKNEEWRKNNKKKFIEACNRSRKRRAERLREAGCINAWSVITKGTEPRFITEDSE